MRAKHVEALGPGQCNRPACSTTPTSSVRRGRGVRHQGAGEDAGRPPSGSCSPPRRSIGALGHRRPTRERGAAPEVSAPRGVRQWITPRETSSALPTANRNTASRAADPLGTQRPSSTEPLPQASCSRPQPASTSPFLRRRRPRARRRRRHRARPRRSRWRRVGVPGQVCDRLKKSTLISSSIVAVPALSVAPAGEEATKACCPMGGPKSVRSSRVIVSGWHPAGRTSG
jgi:hypothetical protein